MLVETVSQVAGAHPFQGLSQRVQGIEHPLQRRANDNQGQGEAGQQGPQLDPSGPSPEAVQFGHLVLPFGEVAGDHELGQVAQGGRHGPVHPLHQLIDHPVAGGLGGLEAADGRPVPLAHDGVLGRGLVGQGGIQPHLGEQDLQLQEIGVDLPFGLLESGPVLGQLLGIVAAQQHVLPFLDLGLEIALRLAGQVRRAHDAVGLLKVGADGRRHGVHADVVGPGHDQSEAQEGARQEPQLQADTEVVEPAHGSLHR